ncbi:cytochrome P450- family 76- subfamily G-polypeptide 1 [Striga hermonthica]|uniref:Cytochrome P450- family 76- subfamily G-polypeptide 1 n=1 Tax=Striga hermonthica TaxID=68872 RepID=A0A9N7N051_STRHE|nr:cytochrome P450- family 76- subfamily G-polypeptide 1 [Striga hermonthica]
MDCTFSLLPCLATLLTLAISLKLFINLKKIPSKSHPPGPPGWPLLGNIFDLGEVPHQTFHKLQAHYGPIMHLRLGSVNTVVLQSSEAAAELFKKRDLQFADRRVLDSFTALRYNRGSVGMASYGDYWRKVRRICTVQFLVQKKVNESAAVRQKRVDEMIEWIKRDVAK